MGPWDTPEVHHGERPDGQHEAGTEVWLQEDEEGRGQSQSQITDGSTDRRTPSCTVDDEAREGQNEQKLAQLGGLEGEKREFESAPRAARGEAEDEDQGDRD